MKPLCAALALCLALTACAAPEPEIIAEPAPTVSESGTPGRAKSDDTLSGADALAAPIPTDQICEGPGDGIGGTGCPVD